MDKFSKCAQIYCIKSKDETANCSIEYVDLMENSTSKKVRKLQCDNEKLYINREVLNFIRYKKIELLPRWPYVHELNGIMERYNRSVIDIIRCLIHEARISRIYWREMMKTVAYFKNLTMANTSENKTPFEI